MKHTTATHIAFFCAVAMFTLLLSQKAAAQQAPRVVQLSGLVTAGDSAVGLAGVAVFVPHTSRGTYTNQRGYFSMPVLAGDSVVVSLLGYGKQYLLIPDTLQGYSYAATLVLEEKATALPTVDVMPWATARDFKMAVLEVKLPEEEKVEVNLGPLQYRSVLHGPSMDAGANADYGIQQQLQGQQRRYMVPSAVKILSIPLW